MQPLIITSITVVFFYVLYKSNKIKNLKVLFIIYSVYLGILGFLFKPSYGYDLYMHYTYLDNARQYGLSILQTQGKSVGLFTYQYMFFIFSKLPIDNFLGMFTAIITNLLPLLVIYHYCVDSKMSRNDTMQIAVMFMCTQNFIGMVSNVRSPIAFSVFVYLLYYENKYKQMRLPALIGYIILVFLHPCVLFPIIFRYVLVIRSKWLKRSILVLLLSWLALVPLFLNITAASSGLLKYMNTMIYEYTQDYANNAHNIVANSTYTIRMATVGIMVCFVLLYRYYFIKGKKSNFFEYLYLAMVCIMFGSIGTSYHFFLRFSSLLIMMSIFPLVTIFINNKAYRKIFKQLLTCLSFLFLCSNYVLQYRTAEFGLYFFR